jgi:hypothetical protein
MARAELSLRVASNPEELSEVLRLRRRHVERAGILSIPLHPQPPWSTHAPRLTLTA